MILAIIDDTTSLLIPTVGSEATSLSTMPMSTMNSSDTSSSTTNLNTITSSMSSNSTTSYTPIAFTTVTNPTGTNINITYKYTIGSEFPLQTGIINNTDTITAVQTMIDASFNLTTLNKTVLQIEILSQTKTISYYYDMLVFIMFTSNNITCNSTCIDNAKLTTNISLSLPLSVIVYVQSGPVLEIDTTTAVNLSIGGPSLGLPAQLGMGIGISLISVLLIAEIIFLYLKFGLSNSPRQIEYEIHPT